MAITYLSGQRVQGIYEEVNSDSLGSSADGAEAGIDTTSRTPIYDQDAMEFDGDDYANIDTTTLFEFMHDGSSWTLSFWLRSNNNSQNSRIFLNFDDSGYERGIDVAHDASAFAVYISSSSAYVRNFSVASTFTDTNWHHFVITFDGTTLTGYKDNSSIASDNSGGTAESGASGTQWNFGYRSSDDDRYLDGDLSDVAIWERVITSGEMTTLFNSFDPTSATSDSNTGKIATTISTTELKAYWKFNNISLDNVASPIVVDDKTTVTDVPAGSQFEETDTRKFYQRSAGSTTRALGDVVWDASESQDATISGNDVYFDNGNEWDVWSRSTDTFTMGDGLATVIWNPHSVATSTAQHTLVGFGKDPISASSANYDNIEFYQYIESNSAYRAYEINSSDTVPAVSIANISGTLTTSTILKMTMDINGQVKYYIDLTGGGTFVLYATSTRNATAGTYYIHVTGKELGGADNVTYSVIKDPAWVERGTAI